MNAANKPNVNIDELAKAAKKNKLTSKEFAELARKAGHNEMAIMLAQASYFARNKS